MNSRRPGRPAVLSHDDILAAAVAIIDAEGLEALTMRRLGGQLGVAAMSLYRHFANRDAVLDAVVHHLAGTVGFEAGGLREFARAYRAMLLRHPKAVALLATRPLDPERGRVLVEPLLAGFTAAGVDDGSAIMMIQSVAVFTLGHALAQVGGEPPEPGREPYYDAWFDAGLSAMLRGFSQN